MYVVFVDEKNPTKELHTEELNAVPSKGDFVNLDGNTLRQVINVLWGINTNGMMLVAVTMTKVGK